MSDQVNAPSNEMPALEDVPETKYTPPEEIKSNLQDMLTNPESGDFVLEMQNLRDEVKQEAIDPLETIMPEIFEDNGEFDNTDFLREK